MLLVDWTVFVKYKKLHSLRLRKDHVQHTVWVFFPFEIASKLTQHISIIAAGLHLIVLPHHNHTTPNTGHKSLVRLNAQMLNDLLFAWLKLLASYCRQYLSHFLFLWFFKILFPSWQFIVGCHHQGAPYSMFFDVLPSNLSITVGLNILCAND